MTPELDKALVNDFPLLYKDRFYDMRSTAMCWGFSCDDGWEPIIRELSECLTTLIEEFIVNNEGMCVCNHNASMHNENGCCFIYEPSKFNDKEFMCVCDKWEQLHPKASQVKEKFGTLRFYMTFGSDEIFDVINDAEIKSAKICEHCGNDDGQIMCTSPRGGWYKTLCITCTQTYDIFAGYQPCTDWG